MSTIRAIRLEMRDIRMAFPGVVALDGVALVIQGGETLALMGENGAGKSTLMKILSGVIPHPGYGGSLWIDSKEVKFRSPLDARKAGVAIIHQELNQFPEMTIAENLLLTTEPLASRGLKAISQREALKCATRMLETVGLNIDPNNVLGGLSVGTRQLIEIARALAFDARVLVLDEPTSALSQPESERLFVIMSQLKKAGKALVYISHRMEEVSRLADRVLVLRDGKSVGEGSCSKLSPAQIISWMVGRKIEDLYPKKLGRISREILRVENLALDPAKGAPRRMVDVSFSVHSGEILGIGGLVGSGRTEVLGALFGAYPEKSITGQIHIDGRKVRPFRTPRDAVAQGMGWLTEDRKGTGLCLDHSVSENLTLAALPLYSPQGLVRWRAIRRLVSEQIRTFRVRVSSPDFEVRTLSGGNQQKVVLSKWLATQPKILLLDEPTRGIDVGSRQEIYQTIRSLADSGLAILMVSSDLPELLGLCDRILVMREGETRGVIDGRDATQESVMRLASGI